MLVQETQTESNPLESANFQRTRDTQAQTDDDEAAKAERHNLDELRTTGAGLIKRSLSKGQLDLKVKTKAQTMCITTLIVNFMQYNFIYCNNRFVFQINLTSLACTSTTECRTTATMAEDN